MKLIWNIPFNGLAITEGGVDTEVLLKEKGLENEVRALMKEVALIAKALGHHIPDSFIDHQIERTFPMGPYRPSSMIDFVEGRPVELEAIWKLPTIFFWGHLRLIDKKDSPLSFYQFRRTPTSSRCAKRLPHKRK